MATNAAKKLAKKGKVANAVYGEVPKAAVKVAKKIAPDGDYRAADNVTNGCAAGVALGTSVGTAIGGMVCGPPCMWGGAAIGGARGGDSMARR